jgi:hypothetical protein
MKAPAGGHATCHILSATPCGAGACTLVLCRDVLCVQGCSAVKVSTRAPLPPQSCMCHACCTAAGRLRGHVLTSLQLSRLNRPHGNQLGTGKQPHLCWPVVPLVPQSPPQVLLHAAAASRAAAPTGCARAEQAQHWPLLPAHQMALPSLLPKAPRCRRRHRCLPVSRTYTAAPCFQSCAGPPGPACPCPGQAAAAARCCCSRPQTRQEPEWAPYMQSITNVPSGSRSTQVHHAACRWQ